MKAMKSMKAMKAMKAMKSMKKAMKKSVIAMYKSKAFAKRAVFTGKYLKTVGGLKKESLIKSKTGKIVSKKLSIKGKKVYAKYLAKWNTAVIKARKALGVKGFVAVGGKTPA